MKDFSSLDALKLAKRAAYNYITNRPLVISYEVTLSCNCNCLHCDLGGVRKDEKQLKPTDYADLTRLLNPPVVQISGGEPLLRKDIVAIAKAIKHSTRPFLILVTNGVLLNESSYLQLYEAGVNQFSVSLDFPDERHDEFRGHPGLYARLEQALPQLAKLGHGNIILNTAITRANLREILVLAQKAMEWGVAISYSAYTALRTGSKDYCIDSEEDLKVLEQSISELTDLGKRNHHVANSKAVLLDTLKFFQQGYMPNCKAGIRFFVVMPDGSFVPCSLHRNKYSSQKEMIKDFSRENHCGACYVAIRSYSEPSVLRQLKDIPHYRRRVLAEDASKLCFR
jgi:MoaA/NifB/PqqE/SkfB family radical SAM enzyme